MYGKKDLKAKLHYVGLINDIFYFIYLHYLELKSSKMLTLKINYKFKNGTTCDFTICKDKNNPIAKAEWSCELNKKNISPLIDEYTSKCVPFVYQKIADFIGESILWVDKKTGRTQFFKPSVAASN